MEKIKIKDLKNLPKREWGKTTIYDSLLVINSRRKHDSGYAIMTIIGCIDFKPIEIAAYCDDIVWDFNGLKFRNDMFYPSGVIQFWSHIAQFEIGLSLSSTDIKLISKYNN